MGVHLVNHTRIQVFILLLLTCSQFASAEELVNKKCQFTLMNMLYQYESKTKDRLEMFEFKVGKEATRDFGETDLKLQPIPFSKDIVAIYRRAPIARKVRSTFSENKVIANIPTKDFTKALKPNTSYTYVVTDDSIVFAQDKPLIMRNLGSKHALLRDQKKKLKLAGEFHVDENGVFHFDGNSGTFKPTKDDVDRGLTFFRDRMGIKNVEAHYYTPPSPAPTLESRPVNTDYQKIRKLKSALGFFRQKIPKRVTFVEMQKLNGQVVTIDGPGKEKEQYRIQCVNSSVDMTRNLSEKDRKIASLRIDKSIEYIAIPVGKNEKPAFSVTLMSSQLSHAQQGQNSEDLAVEIETLETSLRTDDELNRFSAMLKQRFELGH